MTDEAALNTIAHLERALARSRQERERAELWAKGCASTTLAATRERDELVAELATRAQLTATQAQEIDRERHLAHVEQAALQVELEALRTLRDQLLRDLAVAWQVIADLDNETTSRLIDDLTEENRRLRTELAAVNKQFTVQAAAIRLAAIASTTSQGEPS